MTDRLTLEDLMDMKLRDVLDEFCITYSPECDYHYGIARWDDVKQIFENFDLDEVYCFDGDDLIPIDYLYCSDDILSYEDLKEVMSKLGIPLKEKCPKCGSVRYHLDYNDLKMLCAECGYKGQPKYADE